VALRSIRTPSALIVTLVAASVFAPAAAQAAHVSCGDVITADTTLDGDLIDCPSSGLYIGAPGITLDLGGHLVDGNGLGAAGVNDIAGHDDVTIRNGTAQGFSQGVSLHGVSGGLLEDVELRGNFNWGVELRGSHGNVLRGLVAHDNRTDGVLLDASDDNRIEASAANSNGESGIVLYRSDRNVVQRSTATANDEHGIRLLEGEGNALVDSKLSKNGVSSSAFADVRLLLEQAATIEGIWGAASIDMTDSFNAVIAFNQLGGLFAHGLNLTGGELQIYNNYVTSGGIGLVRVHDSAITHNKILPSNDGIGLSGGQRNVVADNVVRGGLTGISTAFSLSGLADNRYERNRVSRTLLDGIELTGVNDVILDNRVMRAGEDGIDLSGPAPVVGGNTANHNGGWGIRAPADAIDAGGNRAHANRYPQQCLNVRC
jgi:parallel beta-helix repeat protein